MSQNIISVRGFKPQVDKDVWIAPNAMVIGDVVLGESSSVWYSATLRGDVMPLRIGKQVNIQDGAVLHGTYGKYGCTIADRVTVGHLAILHGCQIGQECLIGMGSIIMDGAIIGEQCLVGAGSLVSPGTRISAKHLVLGRPAKAIRLLSDEEIESLKYSADNYLVYKTWYEEAL
jgi:gamma-carbonic anhydrase